MVAGPPRDFYPRFGQAVGLLVQAFVLVFLFSILVMGATPRSAKGIRFVEAAAVQEVALVVVLVRGYKRTRSPSSEVFPLGSLHRPLNGWMLVQLAGALVLSSGLASAAQAAWPRAGKWSELDRKVLEGGGSFAVAFLFVVLVGPLVEELLFRGLILHGFLRNYSRGGAIGLSALLFAAFHLDPWKFAPTFVAGFVLATWRAESGALWPCLIGHSVHNAVPVVFHEMIRTGTIEPDVSSPSLAALLATCAVGALVLSAGYALMRSRRRRELPTTPPIPS